MFRTLFLSLVGVLFLNSSVPSAVADDTNTQATITVIRGVATTLSTEDGKAVRAAFRYAFDDYRKEFVGANGVATRTLGENVLLVAYSDPQESGGLILMMEDAKNGERRVFSSARSLLAGMTKDGPRMTRYQPYDIRGWIDFLRAQHDKNCACRGNDRSTK